MSRDNIQLQFNQANLKRNDLSNLPKSFQEQLSYMEHKIRKQLKSFTLLSLCGGNRQNFMVDKNFQRAFHTLILEQKTSLYLNTIKIATKVLQDLKAHKNSTTQLQKIEINLIIMKGSSKSEIPLVINQFKVLSKSKISFHLDLRNYLIRKSKKKQQNCFVLQAMNNSDPETVRFYFINSQEEKQYLPLIKQRISQASYIYLFKLLEQIQKRKTIMDNHSNSNVFKLKIIKEKQNVLQILQRTNRSFLDVSKQNIMELGNESRCVSICEDLVKNVEDQNLVNQLAELIEIQDMDLQNKQNFLQQLQGSQKIRYQTSKDQKKYQKNIFRILLPNYPLYQIPSLLNFGSVYFSNMSSLFVYHHIKIPNIYKLQMSVNLSAEITCKILYHIHLYKNWHPEIKEGQIKMSITSENSCILYQQHKEYSQWYHPRDFVTLAHTFKQDQCYYIAQKSIEHSYFVPFYSVTRGVIQYLVWKIEPLQQKNCRVFAEIKIDHQGMINKSHQKELTVRFLKGFELMEAYFIKMENISKLTNNMSLNWEISEKNKLNSGRSKIRPHNDLSLRTVDFEDSVQQMSEQNEIFYSFEDLSEEEEKKEQINEESEKSDHEISQLDQQITLKESQRVGISDQAEIINFDSEGLIILPKKYIKQKFLMQPFDVQVKKAQFANNNIVLKDHWEMKKTGSLKLINQQKIDAQNNVFRFIMKTMRKNLLTGKGILNISLPVEIFNIDSNIQRVCTSMSLASYLLEKAVKEKDPVQRLKQCAAFAVSNSIIYFDVEKPFNPILGQTYQGYINGCPIYAQQTSHHPPISSVYFVGKGYKVSANLEAKVSVHMNSGEGINWGLYNINFDDGDHIQFQTPSGQISGLSVGDRGFNFKGKCYVLDRNNKLYCQIRFQDSGGFFSKKKLTYEDQVQGQIVSVKEEFFDKFLSSEKRNSPTQKQIVQKISQVSGRWPFSIQFDDQTYYNILEDIPDKLVDEPNPLPSNSLYREDLQYRIMNDLVRSQIQKQRLQIIQRNDRKLREKYHGLKH